MTNVYNDLYERVTKQENKTQDVRQHLVETAGYIFDRLDNTETKSDKLEKYVMNLILRIETLEEEVQSLKNFRSCYDPKFSPFHKPQDTK